MSDGGRERVSLGVGVVGPLPRSEFVSVIGK